MCHVCPHCPQRDGDAGCVNTYLVNHTCMLLTLSLYLSLFLSLSLSLSLSCHPHCSSPRSLTPFALVNECNVPVTAVVGCRKNMGEGAEAGEYHRVTVELPTFFDKGAMNVAPVEKCHWLVDEGRFGLLGEVAHAIAAGALFHAPSAPPPPHTSSSAHSPERRALLQHALCQPCVPYTTLLMGSTDIFPLLSSSLSIATDPTQMS